MFKKTLTSILLGIAVVAEATAGSIQFTYAGDDYDAWGTGKKESYDVAMRIDNPSLIGKKITSVTATVYAVDGISKTSLWLSKSLNLEKRVNVPDIATYTVTPDKYGEMKVSLDNPYTITDEGVYVGYSLTVDELSEDTKTPLLLSKTLNENGLFLHTSRTVLKWMNYGVERLSASAVIEVTIDGDFPEKALDIASIPDIYGKAGASATAVIDFSNCSSTPINEIDYTYTIGDVTKSNSVKLASPIVPDFIHTSQAVLTFDMPEEVGTYTLDLTIDKVNGNVNNAGQKSSSSTIYAVSRLPRHRPVMEEYTGTWCGWCPRGWYALEKMNKLYGSDFIGIAYHNGDPMETIDVYDLPVLVSGFPSATIDRGPEVDPYYGSAMDADSGFGIKDDWEAARDIFSPAAISLYAWWADAEKTTINAASYTEFVIAKEDADYSLSYVLCADDLHSTDASWDQSNYFAKYKDDYVGDELYALCEMPASINDLHFNEVALIADTPAGIEGSLPSTTTLGEKVEDRYSFDVTGVSSLIQDPSKLTVVAMVLDNKTGKIINAIKAPVTAEAGIDMVKHLDNADVVAVRYTDLQGRKVTEPRAGIYVKTVKYSDGSVKTEKMYVK